MQNTLDINFNSPANTTWLSEDTLDKIESYTDRILQEVGILFEEESALKLWKSVDNKIARVEGERVYFDGEALRDIIRTSAPQHFTLHARNPDKSTVIGNGSTVFAPIYGAPKVQYIAKTGVKTGADAGQRTSNLGTLDDYRHLVSLAHDAEALQNTGFMLCVVHDHEQEEAHEYMLQAHLELSDKPFINSILSPASTAKGIELLSSEVRTSIKDKPYLLHLINSTPPLRFQVNPLSCLKVAVENGQACIITAYLMMGAMSPVTILGAMAQGYAEVLTGITLTQLYKPGTSVLFGLYSIPFSMKRMLPTFGDPLSMHTQAICRQLANRLNLPTLGYGGKSSAKVDDFQAGFEAGMATLTAYHQQSDFTMHAAGWLESGRCVDVEKFKREAELLKALV